MWKVLIVVFCPINFLSLVAGEAGELGVLISELLVYVSYLVLE